MSRILVVGGASLDVLHLGGRTVASAGGAGMYTAMAAIRRGARVTLLAPRPEPVPPELAPVADRLEAWLGPAVAPTELPRFEISHEGGTTAYLAASFGAESSLEPSSLPDDLSAFDVVHVVPLGDTARQLSFIRACRARGARRLSAGTYVDGVDAGPGLVRDVVAQADLFFLNRREAEGLFGSLDRAGTAAGRILFVTLGAAGARVIQGGHATDVASPRVPEADPTGAGDAFCGATLAGLADHRHPVMAARSAVRLAAQVIAQVGPAALFSGGPLPEAPDEAGVEVDDARADAVAGLLARSDDAAAFPFVGPGLPRPGHPKALEFFFASTLQQFGFWRERGGRYDGPLVAPLDGTPLKGSSYLFAAYLRRLERDAEFCSPARQAAMDDEELREVFRADDGSDPMPALALHLAQARQYGADMLALGLTPRDLLEEARASSRPLRTLLSRLDGIGGYQEDPLRKKSSLLALVLAQRPERFLVPGGDESIAPVIDYHLMRSCLRTGLVEVRDEELRAALAARRSIGAAAEWAVRRAAWRAIERVTAASGKSTGAVDWFFFGARRRCPETTPPECARCPLDPVCAHRVALFQPVHRTSFY